MWHGKPVAGPGRTLGAYWLTPNASSLRHRIRTFLSEPGYTIWHIEYYLDFSSTSSIIRYKPIELCQGPQHFQGPLPRIHVFTTHVGMHGSNPILYEVSPRAPLFDAPKGLVFRELASKTEVFVAPEAFLSMEIACARPRHHNSVGMDLSQIELAPWNAPRRSPGWSATTIARR